MLAAILKSKYVPKTTESSHDALGILCMCTVRLLCLIYLVHDHCICIMFVLYYLHLFFCSVPTRMSEVRASGIVVDWVLHVEKCFSWSDAFFKDPIVTEFQDAVFNKVELSDEDGIMVPEIRVPHSSVNKRDMETLATLFCGSYREPVVQMDDVPESKNVTSSWPGLYA